MDASRGHKSKTPCAGHGARANELPRGRLGGLLMFQNEVQFLWPSLGQTLQLEDGRAIVAELPAMAMITARCKGLLQIEEQNPDALRGSYDFSFDAALLHPQIHLVINQLVAERRTEMDADVVANVLFPTLDDVGANRVFGENPPDGIRVFSLECTNRIVWDVDDAIGHSCRFNLVDAKKLKHRIDGFIG